MALVLRPSIKDFSRDELEQHIAAIRVRRMAIAFDHAAAKKAELEKSNNKVERRFGEHVVMLEKELAGLDRALEKVEKRMDAMTTLRQEFDFLNELVAAQEIESQG